VTRTASRLAVLVAALLLATPACRCTPAGQRRADPGATIEVEVDLQKRRNVVEGVGGNVNSLEWSSGRLPEALDLLIDTAGWSVFRIIHEPVDWAASPEDVALLRAGSPEARKRIFGDPRLTGLWGTLRHLNDKGIRGARIIVAPMGWLPEWMGGSGRFGGVSRLSPGREDDLAVMLASLAEYAIHDLGLDFSLLAPLNEPDHDGKEGPQVSLGQFRVLLESLVRELDARGLRSVKIVGPDTAWGPARYVSALRSSGALARVERFGIHGYGKPLQPVAGRPASRSWVTETAQWCNSCDTDGAPDGGEWAFASDGGDLVLEDLGRGFGAVLLFEGFDGYYLHHASRSSWGMLRRTADGGWEPRERFWVSAQLARFIRPGAAVTWQRTAGDGLVLLSLVGPEPGAVAILGHVRGGPVRLKLRANGLDAAVRSLDLHTTDPAGGNLVRRAPIAAGPDGIVLELPADSFFSLVHPGSETRAGPRHD
jgi:hypothetical protein